MDTLNSLGAHLDQAMSAPRETLNPDVSRQTEQRPPRPARKDDYRPQRQHNQGGDATLRPAGIYDVQPRVEYSVAEIGCLMEGDAMVLNRQIVPFSDMRRFTVNRSLNYLRFHLLLEQIGDTVHLAEGSKEAQPRPQDRILHPESCRCASSPSSILGFVGRDLRVTRNLSLTQVGSFIIGCVNQNEKFADIEATQNGVEDILPTFWIKAKDQSAPGDTAREMYDRREQKFVWCQPVLDGPLASPVELRITDRYDGHLQNIIYQKYGFTGIYVSMPGFNLVDAGASLNEEQKAVLAATFKSEQFLASVATGDLKVTPFVYRYVSDPRHRDQYAQNVRDMMLRPALDTIQRLDPSNPRF